MTLDEFAIRALAVPFVDHGRDWSGWDCWGLVIVAYRECLGLSLPSHADAYADAGESRTTRGEVAAVAVAERARWLEIDAPSAADVVLLTLAGRPVHVGLMLDGRRFLHAERGVGTIIERLASPIWAKRIGGYYRHAR